MNYLKSSLFVLLFFTLNNLYADTLTIMHYNLMYYDKNVYGCTSETNNVDSKDGYPRTIINFVKPDIFTVNELNTSTASSERIKTNVLNINGETKYLRANTSGSYISNMIYYNSEKLVLKSQAEVATSPRITDVYTLYLKTESISTGDTIFLTCFVIHMDGGAVGTDSSSRASSSLKIMNYIKQKNISGNILLLGDLNLYTFKEGAYINLTTPVGANNFRFYDPIDNEGKWSSNLTFSYIHTQSTHTTTNGCFITGGMDDRFDFILSSIDVLNNSKGLKYYSYKAIAQDGKRYNQSLLSPDNKSVPSEVLNALYNMSDHLPVEMKLVYSNNTTSVQSNDYSNNIIYNNPAPEKLRILLNSETESISSVNIYSIIGQRVFSNKYSNNSKEVEISTTDINSKIFIVEVILSNGYRKTFKVLK
ncbi:MAG TPA: hypothetical protein PK758_00640 [Tenuifilaceae bacterium]|nr:hypothetical protein [Tenuifilaceae bacterium]